MFRKYFVYLIVLGFLIPATVGFAKGNFDYITIKGPGITGEINVTNPALTDDFFAFADFTQGEAPAPADPGQGYLVIRVYVKTMGNKPTDQVFDELHYYPYTGYVFYDGIVNGESEYDGKWYAANPAANEPFRAVLAERARLTWIPFAALLVILAGLYIAYRKK
ncbi:MAG: hypothetical protein C4557_09925 [Anaerolineaceae bacterium]|nr:MAG: hypothetical protein C4557_09925 [Anaerolineaceae bacterium]